MGERFYQPFMLKRSESESGFMPIRWSRLIRTPGSWQPLFDSSCAISALMGIEEAREANYEMKVNGEAVTSGNRQHLPVGIEKLIAFASEFHTLKIGDYLFCGHPFRFRGLRPGDKVQMTLDGKTMLDFRIK